MDESKKAIVSLKQAVWEGAILDLVLLAIASTIMDDGVVTGPLLFLIIAHWVFNVAVLLSPKARNLRAEKDFIRFGIFPLILVTFVARCILGFLGVEIFDFLL